MVISNDSVLPVCAVRYALGRMTYMPSMVVEEIISLLPEMENRDLTVMAKDINEFLMTSDDFLKQPCAFEGDVAVWKRLYKEIVKEQIFRADKD